jgi:glutamine synthetase
MYFKLEYVWLDGYTPEPNLRSKVKIVKIEKDEQYNFPQWSFDGSSTKQAEGFSSDCFLRPVRFYQHSIIEQKIPTIYVLCDVLDKDGNPHPSNDRVKLQNTGKELWVGFEQEYFIRSGRKGNILGMTKGDIEGQGIYYCGVGGQIHGRSISEEHLEHCLSLGINVEGTNAEVAIGQWEYQIFEKDAVKAADDLWMTRYILHKIAEKNGMDIEFHPKPLLFGNWNGSGLHTNFSNKRMREIGGERYFNSIFNAFQSSVKKHIDNYGSDNHLRLTGEYETQSIDKFSWGVSDRGASIRIPKSTAEEWKGYLEDRRPSSNANPYKVLQVILESLKSAEIIDQAKSNMEINIDVYAVSEKYGTLNPDDLLNEYKEDVEFDKIKWIDGSNVETEEIKFDINAK